MLVVWKLDRLGRTMKGLIDLAADLALYTSYGFEPLLSNGLRLFLPMATVRTLAGQT